MPWSMALAMRVRRTDVADAEGVDVGDHEPVTTIAPREHTISGLVRAQAGRAEWVQRPAGRFVAGDRATSEAGWSPWRFRKRSKAATVCSVGALAPPEALSAGRSDNFPPAALAV
jgi:hypothetical protein